MWRYIYDVDVLAQVNANDSNFVVQQKITVVVEEERRVLPAAYKALNLVPLQVVSAVSIYRSMCWVDK